MPSATATKTRSAGNRAPIASSKLRGMSAKDSPTGKSFEAGFVAASSAIQLPEADRDLAAVVEGDIGSLRANGGDFGKIIADEAFMNELVAITVSEGDEQANPYAQLTVNDKRYDIPRGRMVRVPRFVVEALAHAKQANYKTHRSLPGDPRHMVPVERHTFSYPFTVNHDPSGAKGAKWTEKVLADPN